MIMKKLVLFAMLLAMAAPFTAFSADAPTPEGATICSGSGEKGLVPDDVNGDEVDSDQGESTVTGD